MRERWKFIEPTLQKAPSIKIVPMLGSLGCPYTCSFCIDSTVPYQPLDFDGDQGRPALPAHEDEAAARRLARPELRRPLRRDLDAIEEAVPPGRIDFIAESSLSLLSEPHLKRLQQNGFQAHPARHRVVVRPGQQVEDRRAARGWTRSSRSSEHVNMILRYVPYVQTNFVLGLDADEGEEPFELTKQFLDLTPGAFPGYSLLTAFGQAAPLNLEYQRAGRVLPFPFHFLNNNHAMNVRPKNYSWADFYDRVIDLTRYSFSWRAIVRRFRANGGHDPALDELACGRSPRRASAGSATTGRSAGGSTATGSSAPYFEQETAAAAVLHRPGPQGSGAAVGVAAAGGPRPRPERLPQIRREAVGRPVRAVWIGRGFCDLRCKEAAPMRRVISAPFLALLVWFGLAVKLAATTSVEGDARNRPSPTTRRGAPTATSMSSTWRATKWPNRPAQRTAR